MQSDVLSERELRRYTNQINLPLLGVKGQEKLKQSKILVVGAGSKGTSVLQILTASGIGTLGLTDNFMVDEADLPLQKLYGSSDLGKQKAIISKEKLKAINHLTNFNVHNICLSEANIQQIIEHYDLIIDATDNFPAHFMISDAAIQQNKPVVYGDNHHDIGSVTVFNYDNGPSFRCLFPKVPDSAKNNFSSGLVSYSSLSSITGAIMANESIKVVLGLKEEVLNGRLLKIDINNYIFSMEEITKNPKNF